MRSRGLMELFASGIEDNVVVTTDATGSYSRTLYPHETNVTVISTLGVGTINLPPVAQCAGRTYVITEMLGTHDITIGQFQTGDSLDWVAPAAVLAAALDRVMMYSDGRQWWVLPGADYIA
jgi:hypothetical protein